MCHISDLVCYGRQFERWAAERRGILLAIRKACGPACWFRRKPAPQLDALRLALEDLEARRPKLPPHGLP